MSFQIYTFMSWPAAVFDIANGYRPFGAESNAFCWLICLLQNHSFGRSSTPGSEVELTLNLMNCFLRSDIVSISFAKLLVVTAWKNVEFPHPVITKSWALRLIS